MSENSVQIVFPPTPVISQKHLKASWRAAAEVKLQQAWRFVRVGGSVLVAQILAQLVAAGDLSALTNLDQKAIVALLAGAAETAWRQLHPAVTVDTSANVATPSSGGTVEVADLSENANAEAAADAEVDAPEGDAAP